MNVHARKTGRPRRPRWHRPGTAMTEFVLTLPFLAVITGLTFFFGWSLMHKHQVLVADRYSAWQRIETGSWPSEEKLNEIVFDDKASSVSLNSSAGIGETAEDLAAEAGAFGARTEGLASELLLHRLPRGRHARVTAEFDANQALWERFSGAVTHRHGREGITWRRDEVNCWRTLRDLYYSDFDDGLLRVPPPAERMAEMVRGLYLAGW